MEEIPSNSIDYAVMEQSKIIKVVCSDFGWSDVGSFDSLANEYKSDKNNNASSTGNLIAINSFNNFVFSKNIVATIDVSDLLIINMDDALLISKKGSSQKVKELVSSFK